MQKDLEFIYHARFSAKEKKRQEQIWKVLCNSFFNQFFNEQSSVLDIGCGSGDFINNILASRKIAIDLNESVAKNLSPEIHFFKMNALEMNFTQDDGIDTVFVSNFLEHLESKAELELLLDKIYSLLPPSGSLIIMGPNIKFLHGAYWDYYDHHIPLTDNSLCEVLKLKGFKIQVCEDKFLPYSVKGRLPTHPFLVKMYLKFPIVWKILGKQFFIVAKR